MIITIDETFYIEKDNYRNHTLREKTGRFTTDKENNQIEVVKTHGYYSSVTLALEALTHLKIYRAHETVTLNKYIKLMRNERHALEKLLSEE